MHNPGPALVVVLPRDPLVVEGGEGGQDRPARPYSIVPIRWCDHTYRLTHRAREDSPQFSTQTRWEAGEHGIASSEDNGADQRASQVDAYSHDALMYCSWYRELIRLAEMSELVWVEESLCAVIEVRRVQVDYLAVW